MIYELEGVAPVVHPSSFVHPLAAVTGHVVVGKNVYIGPGAAIRGDWGEIVIEDGCNVQENCTLHMFPGVTVYLRKGAHIGHGAVIHGADIGKDCLVGINSVIMDGCIIGDESIIGALSFLKAKMYIGERSLVMGNPAKVTGQVTDKMLVWKKKGTELYQQLPALLQQSLRECEPLREIPSNRKSPDANYFPWSDVKD